MAKCIITPAAPPARLYTSSRKFDGNHAGSRTVCFGGRMADCSAVLSSEFTLVFLPRTGAAVQDSYRGERRAVPLTGVFGMVVAVTCAYWIGERRRANGWEALSHPNPFCETRLNASEFCYRAARAPRPRQDHLVSLCCTQNIKVSTEGSHSVGKDLPSLLSSPQKVARRQYRPG